jgi:hypothetical protein
MVKFGRSLTVSFRIETPSEAACIPADLILEQQTTGLVFIVAGGISWQTPLE